MKILKDGFRADMERIKRELTALQGVSIHVGILGDAGSDILMIAGVHEYGATISAKNAKHLAIPLNMEAKNAGSPRKFNDLRFIPISPGYGFLVRDRKHPQKAPGRKKQEKHDAKKHPSGGEEDPRPNEDYEWMYMLVDSVTIPERSFIRASFDTGKATLENICKEAVDGIILKKMDGSGSGRLYREVGGRNDPRLLQHEAVTAKVCHNAVDQHPVSAPV
jgi:hypothetical protein